MSEGKPEAFPPFEAELDRLLKSRGIGGLTFLPAFQDKLAKARMEATYQVALREAMTALVAEDLPQAQARMEAIAGLEVPSNLGRAGP